MPQHPCYRHLGQGLTTFLSALIQTVNLRQLVFSNLIRLEKTVGLGSAGIFGNTGEVSVTQHPLGQRGKDDRADAFVTQNVKQSILDPSVEHVVSGLMNQTRRA
jgi:hypothetical protein